MYARSRVFVCVVCMYICACVCVCVCTGVLQSFAPWPCGSQTAAGMKIALITACEPPFPKCSPEETDVCRSNGTLSLMAYCCVLYARTCVYIYICVCMQTQILVLSTSLLPVVSFVDWRRTEIIVRGNVKGIIKKTQSEAERELILLSC